MTWALSLSMGQAATISSINYEDFGETPQVFTSERLWMVNVVELSTEGTDILEQALLSL